MSNVHYDKQSVMKLETKTWSANILQHNEMCNTYAWPTVLSFIMCQEIHGDGIFWSDEYC
jgi:hypothetical protein